MKTNRLEDSGSGTPDFRECKKNEKVLLQLSVV